MEIQGMKREVDELEEENKTWNKEYKRKGIDRREASKEGKEEKKKRKTGGKKQRA